MLSELYNDDITVELITGGSNRTGFVYSVSTIKGCEQGKTRQTELSDGRIITTNYILNSSINLDIANTRILKDNKKLELQSKTIVKNHLFGTVDHYEYLY